ncbi:MAG: hypothetical protein ABI743_03920 [bacterium]
MNTAYLIMPTLSPTPGSRVSLTPFRLPSRYHLAPMKIALATSYSHELAPQFEGWLSWPAHQSRVFFTMS